MLHYSELARIIDDVFEVNNIPLTERLPILTGTVKKNASGLLSCAERLSTLAGTRIEKDPHSKNPFRVSLGSRFIQPAGTKIVFWPGEYTPLDESRSSNGSDDENLGGLFRVYPFSYFGLADSSSPDELMKTLLKDKQKEYQETMDTLQIAWRALTEVQQTIASEKAELESIQNEHADLENQKKQIASEIDNGKSAKEALEERIAAQKEVLDAQKDTLSALAHYRAALSDIADPDSHVHPSVEKLGLDAIKKNLKYNYDDGDVQRFLMALNTDQIIILCGAPGTGKTTFVTQMADALGAKCHMIDVQNNWTDSSDLLGFYNPTNETYQSTRFLDALLQAHKDYIDGLYNGESSRLHIICLDEMNLSRVEYYFATFLSLLQQPSPRILHLLPPDIQRKVVQAASSEADQGNATMTHEERARCCSLAKYQDYEIPANVRFVGTLNMDESAQTLSPKVIDRSFFIKFKNVIRGENTSYEAPDAENYYPLSVFTFGHVELPRIKEVFKKENNRFHQFAQKMWDAYSALFGSKADPDTFLNYLIISKVLPAIRKADEFDRKGFDATFKIAFTEYIDNKTDMEDATYYDYLSAVRRSEMEQPQESEANPTATPPYEISPVESGDQGSETIPDELPF